MYIHTISTGSLIGGERETVDGMVVEFREMKKKGIIHGMCNKFPGVYVYVHLANEIKATQQASEGGSY